MLGEYGFAQPKMDDKSSVVFIQHDLSFVEQQELSITCSFGIDVRVPSVIKGWYLRGFLLGRRETTLIA